MEQASFPTVSKAHDFQKAKFTKPANCVVCHKRVWTLRKSEFSCFVCGVSVHKKCMNQAASMTCSGSRQSDHGFQHETYTFIGKLEGASLKSNDKHKLRDKPIVSNLLAVSPDNTMLFFANGTKIHIYNIDLASSKSMVQYNKSIAGIPKAPIRNLICHLLPNGIPIVAAITSCGCVVYRTDNFDAMPIVLGLNQPLGAVAARGAQLAVATVNKQVFIWNVEKEMEKKSATESIVAEDDVIDIDLSMDSSKLLVLTVDGKLRVYALGVMRGIVVEKDVFSPSSIASVSCGAEVVLIADQSDELKVYSTSKLLESAAMDLDSNILSPKSGSSMFDQSLLAKINLSRSPTTSNAPANTLLKINDSVKLIFCSSAPSGKVDIVRVLKDENKVLQPLGTIGEEGAILGMALASTDDFVYLYTVYDNFEVYCYAVCKSMSIQSAKNSGAHNTNFDFPSSPGLSASSASISDVESDSDSCLRGRSASDENSTPNLSQSVMIFPADALDPNTPPTSPRDKFAHKKSLSSPNLSPLLPRTPPSLYSQSPSSSFLGGTSPNSSVAQPAPASPSPVWRPAIKRTLASSDALINVAHPNLSPPHSCIGNRVTITGPAIVGTPTVGTPIVGTPTVGTPVVGTPTVNTATVGPPTATTATVSSPTVTTATVGSPTFTTATISTPTVTTATVGTSTVTTSTVTTTPFVATTFTATPFNATTAPITTFNTTTTNAQSEHVDDQRPVTITFTYNSLVQDRPS